MSNYTTEVRYICESYAGLEESKGYSDINGIIAKAIPKIFEKFEIFDEDYRNVLCTKILRHYYTREIGAETVALWKFWLNTRLNEIMPYFNKMYKSELLDFNPFYDVDLNRTHQKENTGKETAKVTTATETDSTINTENNLTDNTEQTSTSTNTGTNYNLFSDTPQGGLDGVDSETYLTTATKDKINEAKNAIANGADEIDMVINIGAAKDGRFSEVGTDILGVVKACKTAGKKLDKNIIVKTILETCLLDENTIVNCCLVAKKAGADFVKTSTGFANPKGIDGMPLPNGASESHVKLMRKTVGSDMGVKASGGIRSARTLITMLEAGANRIGTSSGTKIIENWDETKQIHLPEF